LTISVKRTSGGKRGVNSSKNNTTNTPRRGRPPHSITSKTSNGGKKEGRDQGLDGKKGLETAGNLKGFGGFAGKVDFPMGTTRPD